jgi:hypothetical protein
MGDFFAWFESKVPLVFAGTEVESVGEDAVLGLEKFWDNVWLGEGLWLWFESKVPLVVAGTEVGFVGEDAVLGLGKFWDDVWPGEGLWLWFV